MTAEGRKPIISFESRWGSDGDRPSLRGGNDRRGKPANTGKVHKSLPLAYLLWFLLGAVGAHRFYLRRPGTALIFLALFVTQGYLQEGAIATAAAFLLVVLWVVDAFQIPQMVRELAQPEPKEAGPGGAHRTAAVSSSSSSAKAADGLRTAAKRGRLADAMAGEESGGTTKRVSHALARATGQRLDGGKAPLGGRAVAAARHERDVPGHPPRRTGKGEAAPQDILAAIEKLHALYQAGALKKEEFEREKKELLRKL